ncbi:MAG: ATP-binding cassette domain-containing protein [Betaproteobacteria bacterium]
MPLVTLDQACLAFGHVPLLDHVDLALEAGERAALIGRNGSGKSSLLRAIAGEQPLDSGTLWSRPELRIARVAQEPLLEAQETVFEAVARGAGAVHDALLAFHEVSHQLARAHDSALLERMNRVQRELDQSDGWRINTRIESLISRFGLDADASVRQLSGGYRKRVALAQALASDPELLLLDEPTNHLDIDAIEWLEGLITAFPGCVLLVTHDRRFLDNVSTRILELDRGVLRSFAGGFSEYQRRKEEVLNSEAVANARFDKLLAQEEAWIRKGVEARRTRNEGRVRRLEQLRRERADRRERLSTVSFSADTGERSGKMVVELTEVSKRFDGKRVVEGFSTRVLRGDRIGLVGPNGSGKTTLLRLMLGEIAPDSGTVRRGARLAIAYFDQLREQLDEEATLVEAISPGSEFVEVAGERKHVIGYLGEFLFPPERARAKVSSLSGGERNRLLLARLFTRPANLLVLDEPTNDLDIETLELLEALLQDYAGTLFLVSHDRTFLDNVVTQVIAFEGDGVLHEYAGGYSDWERQRREGDSRAADAVRLSRRDTPPRAESRPAARARLSYKEAGELEALPQKISALEDEQARITRELGDPAVYRDAPDRVKALQARYGAVEDELMACLARWEELGAKK